MNTKLVRALEVNDKLMGRLLNKIERDYPFSSVLKDIARNGSSVLLLQGNEIIAYCIVGKHEDSEAHEIVLFTMQELGIEKVEYKSLFKKVMDKMFLMLIRDSKPGTTNIMLDAFDYELDSPFPDLLLDYGFEHIEELDIPNGFKHQFRYTVGVTNG